tara:strand:+ start:975 stop:1280 length:306 start_codon:yes stop_codon:yes gene_type:complete
MRWLLPMKNDEFVICQNRKKNPHENPQRKSPEKLFSKMEIPIRPMGIYFSRLFTKQYPHKVRGGFKKISMNFMGIYFWVHGDLFFFQSNSKKRLCKFGRTR